MNPIILAFNIRQSVYRTFGLSLFQKAKSHGIYLLPIITTSDDGIQDRAKKLNKQIPQLLHKINIDKAHFACYSVCGVDFRFALSEFDLRNYCKTLTTISTPHKGSKLALLSDHKFFKPEIMDPVSRLTGIGFRPFHEFTPQNMKGFNSSIFDVPEIKYYSLGSQRMPNLCSKGLQDTGKYLQYNTQANMVYYNDGVFGYDQIEHGTHIVNFQADHAQVIGIYGQDKELPAIQTVIQIANDYQMNIQADANSN